MHADARRSWRLCVTSASLFVLWALSACGGAQAPFKDAICSPPCWEGITPGETTKTELLNILAESAMIESGSVEDMGAENIFDDSVVFGLRSDSTVWVYLIDDKVMLMTFDVNLGITFDEAIQKFGTPENFTHERVICKNSVFPLGESRCIMVRTINQEKGIYFDGLIPLSDHIELTSDVQVDYVGFFDPNAFDKLLEASEFLFGMYQQEFLDALIPWTGYGVLENK